jgi:hypothetical protein
MTPPLQELSPAPWLALVRQLTELVPGWVIWKNAEAAFAGSGDVDSAASSSDWPEISRTFQLWASDNDFGPVIECRHPPRTMFLVAVREQHELVELDVLERKYFRGGTLFTAEGLVPLSRMDSRGFRVLRSGAQGLIVLLGNGIRWGGRPNPDGLRRRRVAELLSEDLEGVDLAARRFGLPVSLVRRVAEGVSRGGWDRGSLMLLEAWALLKAVGDPGTFLRRARFRLLSKKRCPVLRAIFYDDRQLPADVEGWLANVRRSHVVRDVGQQVAP